MKYLKNANTWSLTPDIRLDVRDSLPAGNYTVCRNPLSGDYYLEESEPFTLPKKLYGKTVRWAERILDAFEKEEHQTGVLLSGLKGSGKTLLSKYVSATSGLPVLIVNAPFSDDRFMRTVQGIEQRAVILFDEFEKLYDPEAQERILTLFDGVYTAKNKIMILTCNDRMSVRDFFHNRPGRLRYSIDFQGLSADFIKEYCADQLQNSEYLDDILKTAVGCGEFNFDMLQALVRELNLYGGTVEETVEILNVKPLTSSRVAWDIKLSVPSAPNLKLTTNTTFSEHPITWFQRRNGCTFDFSFQSSGSLPDGKKSDENEDSYAELSLNNLKQVDPNTNTYNFEIEADIHLNEEESVTKTVLVRVTEEIQGSFYRGGWGFGNDF